MKFESKEFNSINQFSQAYHELKKSIGDYFNVSSFRLLAGSVTLYQKYEGNYQPAIGGSLPEIKSWIKSHKNITFKLVSNNLTRK